MSASDVRERFAGLFERDVTLVLAVGT